MQVYYKNASLRNTPHFAQYLYDVFVGKVMGKQRTDRKIERPVRERQPKGVAADSFDLCKMLSFTVNRCRGILVQVDASERGLSSCFSCKFGDGLKDLTRACSDVQNTKGLQILFFDFAKKGFLEGAAVAEEAVYKPNFVKKTPVFLGRVIAGINAFEF